MEDHLLMIDYEKHSHVKKFFCINEIVSSDHIGWGHGVFPLRGFKPHKNICFMIFDLVFGVVIEYVCLLWNALFS